MFTLLRLFFEFFKTGLFSIGGGLATLPFLYEMADKTGWFSHADIADMIAVSESTPGAIGVNMSTYAGFTTSGVIGGIIATLGLITPSIIIIIIVAHILEKFKTNKYVQRAFYGLRPASIALITAAGFNVVKISLININLFKETGSLLDLFTIKAIIFAVIMYFLQKKFKCHMIVWIALSAVVGIVFNFAG